MTEALQLERWETPVSNAESLVMVSLVDSHGLHITVQDLRDPHRRRYRFTFGNVPAYRNVLEEYRTSEPPAGSELGWTVKIPNSLWLKAFRQNEPLLEFLTPGCEHYVIVTEDDVIDILSPKPPEISEVEPGAPNEPAPGKSHVLYNSKDREQIDQFLHEIRKRFEKTDF